MTRIEMLTSGTTEWKWDDSLIPFRDVSSVGSSSMEVVWAQLSKGNNRNVVGSRSFETSSFSVLVIMISEKTLYSMGLGLCQCSIEPSDLLEFEEEIGEAGGKSRRSSPLEMSFIAVQRRGRYSTQYSQEGNEDKSRDGRLPFTATYRSVEVRWYYGRLHNMTGHQVPDITSTRKHPATSPKPSFSTLRAQTPTSPRNQNRHRAQCTEVHLRDSHRTLELPALSSPTERNRRCD